MFSPIRAKEVDCESCDAHLIPVALKMSSATVISERFFDNTFGTRHDNQLIRHVVNMTSEWKDVAVMFIDEESQEPLNKTPIRTKWKHTGPRPEDVSLQLDLKENLKKHVKIGAGSLLKVTPHSPPLTECAHIGLSMLHSAFLTMYYHFGKDYVCRKEVIFIQTLLQNAVREQLSRNAIKEALQFFRVSERVLKAFEPLPAMLKESFSYTRHPIWKLNWDRWSCMLVILPYHANYNPVCLLPGLHIKSYSDWNHLMKVFQSKWKAVTGSVVMFDPPRHANVNDFWDYG